MDYSKLTDDELRAMLAEEDVTKAPPGKGSEVAAARNAATAALDKRQNPPTRAEEIEPSALKRGFAALGAELVEPAFGAKEKFELVFPGKGQADAVAERIGRERTERRAIRDQLEATPAGMVGGTVGKGLPLAFAATPQGAAGTAAVLGFLGGGHDNPSRWYDELGTSGITAGIDAATTYLPAKGLQLLGKTAGAATGQLTKEGAHAKEVEAAAKRLGIPLPTFGQVYPQSGMASFEKASPTYGHLINEQAEALRDAITKSTKYGVDDVGGAYLDELRKAVANRYDLGKQMYRKVDELVDSNGLGKFMPNYTANVVTNTSNKGFGLMSEELAKYGFDVPAMGGMKAKDLAKLPLRFEDFNTMRVATNKAWGNINRSIDNAQFAGNPVTDEMRSAKGLLTQLRAALDNDAERWAKQNLGNREAVTAFKDATAYWKDQVVPTVVENPFARKVASTRRGFPTGERATSLSLSNANIPLVDRLLPTMSGRGADMTEIMRTLPEVRATALTGEAAQMPQGPLHAFVSVAEGRREPSTLLKLAANTPLVAPALRASMNSALARRMAGAQDVLGRTIPRAALYSTAVPWGSGALQEYATGRLRDHGD